MSDTVVQMLEKAVADFNSMPAMKYKTHGQWQSISWSEYGDLSKQAGRAFMALGVEAKDGVSIIGYNCPQWVIAMMGAAYAAAWPAGIYTTCSAEQCHYITDHCDASVAVVENEEHLQKFLEVRGRLPKLKAIIMMFGSHDDPNVYSWEEFLALAEKVPEDVLRIRTDAVQADDVAGLIYTSGTTGNPKAVMLTHRNSTWTTAQMMDQIAPVLRSAFGGQLPQEAKTGFHLLSYLPLCHVAEQGLTVFAPMVLGGTVWFAEGFDQLGDNLSEVRPHFFLGVPRVWEKIQAKMLAIGAQATPTQKKLIAWAKTHGAKYSAAVQAGEKPPFFSRLVTEKLLAKARQKLGLDRSVLQFTGAAPIARDTLDYFASVGIPIYEVYGMSESSGPATVSYPGVCKPGKAGVVLKGAELKIAEDGEVLMRGGHVFAGYLKNEEATADTLDADGWLHSGDIGTIDEDGFLQITDRKKELIITAGGENIAPQMVEGKLKAITLVDQAVVIGDRRKFLTALLVLDEESLQTAAAELGSPATNLAEASQCDKFKAHIESQVAQVNTQLARVQTIKRWTLLENPLTPETGELTPTMKLKRRIIHEKYADEIEALYAGV